jgi:hypothetical protein
MAYHLPKSCIEIAITHICKYGDTDIFPHLPEIAFFRDEQSTLLKEMQVLDLETYSPGSAFEALAPKSRYGFRIAHQLPALDTLLLLAATIEIAPQIEKHRGPTDGSESFSYRVKLDKKGHIFRGDRTYKDWLNSQVALIQANLKIKQVITTDISDFYARINFHRLENLLDEVAPHHGAARFIKKYIKVIRAKQSFGLPVGGSAARLLAELSLIDTDKALRDEGHAFTRFVDDFRLFLRGDENPYDTLAFLAEQLGINEGLALNVSKTAVVGRAKYLIRLKELVTDVSDQAEGKALDALVTDLYFDDEPKPGDLVKLKSMNLLGYLQEEVGKDVFDMGRIKVIFRALKLAKPVTAITYLTTNFAELVVFARELTLLMQALEGDNGGCFNQLGDVVVEAIRSPPASSVQLIRTWLLELFVRGTVPITTAQLKNLIALSSALDERQLNLIRGRIGDKNYFRKKKTAFGQTSAANQATLVWGAGCLPKDEYKAWLSAVKPMYAVPSGGLFLKWAQAEQEKLTEKLNFFTDEHQE